MSGRLSELEGSGVRLDAETLIGLRAEVLQRRQKEHALVALPGGFRIRQRGNGQDIADSRAYVAGDDLRHIDRGATARTGQIYTKTFHAERDKMTHLVADFRPAMLWGMRRAFHSVAAARALTMLGWQSVEAGGRVGLLAVTGRDAIAIPPRGRTRGMLAVIGGLIQAHDMALEYALDGLTTMPLDSQLDGLKRIASKGSEIIVASGLDTPGDTFHNLIAELCQKRHPHFLIVQDHSLQDLPAGRYPIRLTKGGRLNIGLASSDRKTTGAGGDSIDNSTTAILSTTIPKTHIDAGASTTEVMRQLGM